MASPTPSTITAAANVLWLIKLITQVWRFAADGQFVPQCARFDYITSIIFLFLKFLKEWINKGRDEAALHSKHSCGTSF